MSHDFNAEPALSCGLTKTRSHTMLRVFVGVLFVAAGILHFTHTSTLVGVMAGM